MYHQKILINHTKKIKENTALSAYFKNLLFVCTFIFCISLNLFLVSHNTLQWVEVRMIKSTYYLIKMFIIVMYVMSGTCIT